MEKLTRLFIRAEDVGKNVYRQKTYYTLVLEQDVLARDQDEANDLFRDGGGVNYERFRSDLALEDKGVETNFIDINYTETDNTEYLGKVVYEDTEFAKEDGDVEIDPYADEFKQPEKETV